jgi:aspartate kinase
MKFGGTSVMDAERIARAARIITGLKQNGAEIVVVVSAMGHTTDHLIDLAKKVQFTPNTRELDLLLATGEQAAAALLAMALEVQGIEARSFTGACAGILTGGTFGNAKIENVETEALESCLKANVVPVVAGFQGISTDGEVTTLGRGGSDTTAIALAAALNAERCDIYTDVNGIYTADPRIATNAFKLDALSYNEMLEMAKHGAQVLNPRAVEIARDKSVAVRVRSTFEPSDEGTLVGRSPSKFSVFTGVSTDSKSAFVRVSLNPPRSDAKNYLRIFRRDRSHRKNKLVSILASAHINFEVGCTFNTVAHELDLCIDKTELEKAIELLRQNLRTGEELFVDMSLARVSIISQEMSSTCEIDAVSSLSKSRVPIKLLVRTAKRLSIFVPENRKVEAVNLLHEKLERVRLTA